MSLIDITISCPHCRRQYTMKTDPERLQRVKTRATCGRCRNSFDVASRIVAPSSAPPPPSEPLRPPLPKLRPPPPPMPNIKAGSKTPTMSELTDLAREFADAAARFTPVGIRPAGLSKTTSSPSLPKTTSSSSLPAQHPASVAAQTQVPTRPDVKPPPLSGANAVVLPRAEAAPASPEATEPAQAPVAAASAADEPAPAAAPPPAAASVDAAAWTAAAESSPAAEPEPDLTLTPMETGALDEFDDSPETHARTAAAPVSWIDLADPGIAHLIPPPSPAATALEQLL